MQNLTSPITEQTPIAFQDALPAEVDVVVIGGGVIGVFAALYLRRLGKRVLVLEKGRVAGEQSSRNWGWIRQTGRDAAELPIMMEANRLWGEFDQQTGGRTGFKRCGVTYLARDADHLERLADWLDVARTHQLDTRLMSSADLDGVIDRGVAGTPQKPAWIGGITTLSDARAEPWQAVPVLAELAHSEGVQIRENCAARALDLKAGAIVGLHTEHGIVKTAQVVLAAGAWSSLFLQRHGVALPQLAVRATVARTAPMPGFISGQAGDGKLAFRRRDDGGYSLAVSDHLDHYVGRDSFRHLGKFRKMARSYWADTRLRPGAQRTYPDAWSTPRKWDEDAQSPFERNRVLNPEPNMATVAVMQSRFAERFPKLGPPKILNAWAGMIDATPDIVPVVDRHPKLRGLIIATGMSGHGFGIGPGFGRIIADIAADRATGHDLARFRFSRFTDGSKMVLGPTI